MPDREQTECPHCGYGRMEKVTNTNGTFECMSCEQRTHEKIEANRHDLEDLAESDSPVSRIASLLVGGSDE